MKQTNNKSKQHKTTKTIIKRQQDIKNIGMEIKNKKNNHKYKKETDNETNNKQIETYNINKYQKTDTQKKGEQNNINKQKQ